MVFINLVARRKDGIEAVLAFETTVGMQYRAS